MDDTLDRELERLDTLDARGLDAAMRRVRSAMQRRDAQLAAALAIVLEARLFRDLGFSSFAAYGTARLGIPERTARELVRVANGARRCGAAVATAWSCGELSWLQTLTLLPVARTWNASAWVQRAGQVTLRRLAEEVDWAFRQMHADPRYAAAMPPPADHALRPPPADDRQRCADAAPRREDAAPTDHAADAAATRPADDRQRCADAAPRREDAAPTDHAADAAATRPADDRQKRADVAPRREDAPPTDHAADAAATRPADDRQKCADAAPPKDAAPWSRDEFFGVLGRFRVTMVAPKPVSEQFRQVMQSFAHPAEPRWLAFERMLEQVLIEWQRQPRHRDPVFERDDYRCTAPGCSSRRNLHDHHIVPRSMGGTNDLSNRTTLCAWHHLRGIHGGVASASGDAPGGIDWELGLDVDGTSFLQLRGDRYRRR